MEKKIEIYLTNKKSNDWFIDELNINQKEFERKMKETVQKLIDEYINKDEVHCVIKEINIEEYL